MRSATVPELYYPAYEPALNGSVRWGGVTIPSAPMPWSQLRLSAATSR